MEVNFLFEPNIINKFRGEYWFLSNMYPAKVFLDGIEYPTVEHAYQASKTNIEEERQAILDEESPFIVKKNRFNLTIIENFNDIRLTIMEDLVRQKFTLHSDLKEKLINTGAKQIIEGNDWGDKFWGVFKGKGKNNLGIILMKVRSEITEQNIFE